MGYELAQKITEKHNFYADIIGLFILIHGYENKFTHPRWSPSNPWLFNPHHHTSQKVVFLINRDLTFKYDTLLLN